MVKKEHRQCVKNANALETNGKKKKTGNKRWLRTWNDKIAEATEENKRSYHVNSNTNRGRNLGNIQIK